MSHSPHHSSPPKYPFITSIVLFLIIQHIPSIFSSPGHIIFTKKTHVYLFLLSHTHTQTSSLYFHSIHVEPLTGSQPLLTINITLVPTLPFAYLSFWGLTLHVCILCSLSFMPKTIPPPSPVMLLDSLHKSHIPHISVIFHSKHSHPFLIHIHKL